MLRRVDAIEIDPTQMSDSDAKVLFAFLKKNPEQALLRRNNKYTITTTEALTTFRLTHNLIQRDRKEGKDGIRYEVYLDNNDYILGMGSFRQAIAGIGNISLQADTCAYKAKSRVLKVRNYTDKQEKVRESQTYEIEKTIPHLHAKKPTFHDGYTYFGSSTSAMKRFKGKNLYKILQDEELGEIEIDFTKRLRISINILTALQNQVHVFKTIHRDFKPENIILDPETDAVFIIDFEFSRIINGANPPEGSGTPIYMPIEQFTHKEVNPSTQTDKIDIYAAGKTLADLWHAYYPQPGFFKAWQAAEENTKVDFEDSKLSEDTPAHKAIRELILKMTKANADERPDLKSCIEALENLAENKTKHVQSSARMK